MKLRTVQILVLSIGVALLLNGCTYNRHGWQKIRIDARYSDGRLSIDQTDPHDVGVSGLGDQVSWILECATCPTGSRWRVTDLQRVADLDDLTNRAMRMFQEPDLGLLAAMSEEPSKVSMSGPVGPPPVQKLKVGIREDGSWAIGNSGAEKSADIKLAEHLRNWLGIMTHKPNVDQGEGWFDLTEPGWREWAPTSTPIRARLSDDSSKVKDALWKFSIEIREEGSDFERPCAKDPKCALWDPHKYTHPGRKR